MTIPLEAGFYWHRDSSHTWEMLEVRDFGGFETLSVYSVNRKWGGLSLKNWLCLNCEIGEWIKIEPPPQ